MPAISPEFGGFTDPEDVDWIPPAVPKEADLPVNTTTWGPFYRWAGRSSQIGVVALALTREIHPPWHVGVGIGIRWDRPGEPYAYVVGVWWKSRPPRILDTQPAEQDLHTVVEKANRLDKLHPDLILKVEE
jgi:hypothetical protein